MPGDSQHCQLVERMDDPRHCNILDCYRDTHNSISAIQLVGKPIHSLYYISYVFYTSESIHYDNQGRQRVWTRDAFTRMGGSKRHRDEDDHDENPLLKIRKLVCEENSDFAADAENIVKICFGTPSSLLTQPTVWRPQFVHQQFPAEKLFGYKDPLLCIYYSDPDLRIAVVGAAAAVTPPVLGIDSHGGPARVAPDNVQSVLEDALPPGFTHATSFSLNLGAHHVQSLRASCMSLPAHVQLYPGDGAGEGGPSWGPPGILVRHYTGPEGRQFVVHRWSLCSTPATRSYHERMQTLSLWYIETGSAVDVHDPAWTVYGTYEKGASTGGYSFVGYMTVYRFTNPLRARPDTLRLAQLLLLPSHQRAGHGAVLLHALYTDAARGGMTEQECRQKGWEVDPEPSSHPCASLPCLPGGRVQDVTVESPCLGMTRLRDKVDTARAYEGRVFQGMKGWEGYGPGGQGQGEEKAAVELVVEPPAPVLQHACMALHCTLGQAAKAYHALLLARMDRGREEVVKAYRLMIKRYILRTDADVAAMSDMEARKVVLEDRYCEYAAACYGALTSPHWGVSREEIKVAEEAWEKRQGAIEGENGAKEEQR